MSTGSSSMAVTVAATIASVKPSGLSVPGVPAFDPRGDRLAIEQDVVDLRKRLRRDRQPVTHVGTQAEEQRLAAELPDQPIDAGIVGNGRALAALAVSPTYSASPLRALANAASRAEASFTSSARRSTSGKLSRARRYRFADAGSGWAPASSASPPAAADARRCVDTAPGCGRRGTAARTCPSDLLQRGRQPGDGAFGLG